MTRPVLILAALVTVVALFVSGWFYAMQPAHAGGVFTGQTPGIAINGYDPVGYFNQNKPIKGSADHTYSWNGVDWHFASAKNLETFSADPERYAPQYGGYCAYAAAKDSLAKTEPDAFTIYDGKLYLNFNQSVKGTWDGSKEAFISTGDKNWPDLLEQARARN